MQPPFVDPSLPPPYDACFPGIFVTASLTPAPHLACQDGLQGKHMAKKRVGLLTAGGDCQGLNAVIRAVVKRAIGEYGWDIVGFEDGYTGMMPGGVHRPVTADDVRGILPRGGTILGTSNKANPFQ